MLLADLGAIITRSHPAFTPNDLRREQQALWSILPYPYRDFLGHYNGGLIEEGGLCFDTPIPYFEESRCIRDHQSDCVIELFAFQSPGAAREPRDLTLLKMEHDERKFLPGGMVAIAECLGSSLLCLSTRSEDLGAVYYWDYYWRYPWCRPFFDPRIAAAKRAFPDMAAIRGDPLHPHRQAAVDALNYATLVRLADDLTTWLAACRLRRSS